MLGKGALLWRVIADANVGTEGVLDAEILEPGMVKSELALLQTVDVKIDH